MKQVPFDLDKYFMGFDRKQVLHNQDEKLVACSSMNEKVCQKMALRIKVCKKVKFAYFYKFNTLRSLRWKAKTSNSLTILTLLTNSHKLSL